MNYQQLKKIVGFYSRFTASLTQVGHRWRRLSWPKFTPDYRGQRWLVTGGSGGIGRHIVLESARAGATVTAVARNESKLGALRDAASGVDTALWLAGTRPAQPEHELVWFDRAIRPAHVYERTRASKDTPQSLAAYLESELARQSTARA